MLRPQFLLLLVLLPLCHGALMDEKDIDTSCVEGHLEGNIAVQDAITKCFKDVPVKDSQSDPANEMKNLKVQYEKLLQEYKKALKSDESEDEIENEDAEPEDDGEENEADDSTEETYDEDPQNDDKDDISEAEKTSSKGSPSKNSAESGTKGEITVNGDEATEVGTKDSQNTEDKSSEEDALDLLESDEKGSKNQDDDRKEDLLETPNNDLEDKVAEEEVDGDLSKELGDHFEDEALNGVANGADGDESSSIIPGQIDQEEEMKKDPRGWGSRRRSGWSSSRRRWSSRRSFVSRRRFVFRRRSSFRRRSNFRRRSSFRRRFVFRRRSSFRRRAVFRRRSSFRRRSNFRRRSSFRRRVIFRRRSSFRRRAFFRRRSSFRRRVIFRRRSSFRRRAFFRRRSSFRRRFIYRRRSIYRRRAFRRRAISRRRFVRRRIITRRRTSRRRSTGWFRRRSSGIRRRTWRRRSMGRPGRPNVNGCSIPFGLYFPYKHLFTPSCNRHDVCYYRERYNRRACDNMFYRNMLHRCSRTGAFKKFFCRRFAGVYYAAVRIGGKSHYG